MSLIVLCNTISKCLLSSGLHRAIYDASNFVVVLTFFGEFEIFQGFKLFSLVLYSFHLSFASRLLSHMESEPYEQSPIERTNKL